LARNKFDSLRKEIAEKRLHGTIKIQSIIRMKLAVRKVDDLRTERDYLRLTSIIKMQCLVRRRLSRKKLDSLKKDRAQFWLTNVSNNYLQRTKKVELRSLKNLVHTKMSSA